MNTHTKEGLKLFAKVGGTVAVVWALSAMHAAGQQALPPMTEQQQINAWKARALAAEQRAVQAEQLAASIQQPNPVPETRPAHWVKYEVDGRNVLEFKSKLNPGMVCAVMLGREGISCARN